MKKIILGLSVLATILISCEKEESFKPEEKVFEDKQQQEGIYMEAPTIVGEDLKTGGIKSKFWANGSTITVKFLDGSSTQISKVKKRIAQWEQYANLKFNYTTGNAQIRIDFVQDGNSWSYVGKDALSITDQSKPTVHFGWLTNSSSDAEYDRVVLHEFGHVLGLVHEHQLQSTTVCWNKPVVYAHYAKYGWSKSKVDHNVINQYSKTVTQYSAFDAKSIMTYNIPQSFTTCNWTTPTNSKLSDTDKVFVGQVYPFNNGIIRINIKENRIVTDFKLRVYFKVNGKWHYDWETLGDLNKNFKLNLNTSGKRWDSGDNRYEGNFLKTISTSSGKFIQISKTDLSYFEEVKFSVYFKINGKWYYDWETLGNLRSTTLEFTGWGGRWDSADNRYEGNFLKEI